MRLTRVIKKDFVHHAHLFILSFKGQSVYFSFFGSFILLVPRKVPWIYWALCKNWYSHKDMHTDDYAWLTLPPAFYSKIATIGEANLAIVDIMVYQRLLCDAPGGLGLAILSQVIWSCHSFRKYSAIHWCWAQLNSVGNYLRFPVSFDGGESLDSNIKDLMECKCFSFLFSTVA